MRLDVKKVARRWVRRLLARSPGARQGPRKLRIFDFDGTLYRSPTPPDAHEGEWWGSSSSLEPPHVPEGHSEQMWHPDAVDRMRQSMRDPNVHTVVMTGRREQLSPRILELLEEAGLRPDSLMTNPEKKNVTRYKIDHMKYLLQQLPDVEEVEFWEDRKQDLVAYERAARDAGIEKFVPKLVGTGGKPPPYVGIFLAPDVKRQLLEDFPAAHQGVQADHVTLVFKPTAEQLEVIKEKFPPGTAVPIKVTGVAQDEKAQALEVELPPDVAELGTNQRPHVTVSVAEGVSPVYSNELLSGGTQKIDDPKSYAGYLDLGPRPGSPRPKFQTSEKGRRKLEKARAMWKKFLDEEVWNPEFGKPGFSKKMIRRKTMYDRGGQARRRVLSDWERERRNIKM